MLVSGEGKWELVGGTGCTVERQAECDVDLLPDEEYVIIPCTTGAKFRQQDGYVVSSFFFFVVSLPFALTILIFIRFTLDTPLYLLSEDGNSLSEMAEPCFREIFDRMNMDMDGYMNKKEIKKFLKAIQPGLESDYVSTHSIILLI